ncbi:hypothetical protein [Parasitella parasitica]|uniref:Uncharacterized protein n=1 Tax=Parasitella parasitica TaxID=35722 RepID=A0A0B7NNZ4_9FUNG|nr:hypothetical protein [Parasitella parasitica]
MPGGYIELTEAELWYHNPGPVQSAFQTFHKEQCNILEKGFELVEKQKLNIPIGAWAPEPELKQYGFINKEIQTTLLK